MTHRTRAFARLAVLAGAGALAAGLAAPAAFADSPSTSAQASVTVAQSISFAFTSPASFTLTPGQTQAGALAFTVSTNDHLGATITLAAPDLTLGGGAASIPAGDLSYISKQGGSEVDQGPQALTNAAAQVLSFAHATDGTGYTQDWTATVPASTPPGSYSTTLTFVATGN